MIQLEIVLHSINILNEDTYITLNKNINYIAILDLENIWLYRDGQIITQGKLIQRQKNPSLNYYRKPYDSIYQEYQECINLNCSVRAEYILYSRGSYIIFYKDNSIMYKDNKGTNFRGSFHNIEVDRKLLDKINVHNDMYFRH